MKLDLSAMGGGDMTIEQRFDGTAGYSLNSMQGDTEITGNQLENLRNSVFPSPFLKYKEAGMKMELLPGEQVGGKQAIVLRLTPKTGSASRIYLDPETYLVMRGVSMIDSPQGGGQIEQATEVSDYRTVDGVKVAFQVLLSSPAQSVKLVFKSVEDNVAIDDAMFSKK
jgi:outer membrane lipoprotein-sorting protein